MSHTPAQPPRHVFLPAPVRPRVRLAPDGDALPLEYHVGRLLEAGASGVVNVYGPPGSGKSMALAHLAVLFDDPRLLLIDDAFGPGLFGGTPGRLVVATTHERAERAFLALKLVPWGEDDLIEYLLHVHHNRCKSVMARLHAAADRDRWENSAGFCAAVLDEFAADERIVDIAGAVRAYAARRLTHTAVRALGSWRCLRNVLETYEEGALPLIEGDLRLLRYRYPAAVLAAEQLAQELREGVYGWLSKSSLPEDLLQATAALVREDAGLLRAIVGSAQTRPPLQPMTAGLLVACDPAWRPPAGPSGFRFFNRLQARGVRWGELDFSKASFDGAVLPGADLSRCKLEGATAENANFAGANFRSAELRLLKGIRAIFTGADFREAHMLCMIGGAGNFAGADLSDVVANGSMFAGAGMEGAILENALLCEVRFDGANLKRACFRRALLRHSLFSHVVIEDADFTGADLAFSRWTGVTLRGAEFAGTTFHDAVLHECDLERMELERADFRDADLTGSYLTGSHMPRANFEGAVLRNTGLADVSWENADLRDADFSGASFHMGSSRSGLVGSTIASEGTRTGFYTDDYLDQTFKAPEEVRKANLCGCDLRGANVEGCDFYLVDLRGAMYSDEQARHFARCGAILHARAEG